MSRGRWLLLALCAIAVFGAVLGVMLWRDNDSSSSGASTSDCAVVARLAREFRAMDGQDQTGGGVSAGFAETVRTATGSVTDRQLQMDLEKWAQGFSQLADVQQGDVAGAPGPDKDAEVMRAGDTIYGTADALRRRCPEAWSVEAP